MDHVDYEALLIPTTLVLAVSTGAMLVYFIINGIEPPLIRWLIVNIFIFGVAYELNKRLKDYRQK